jgi:hypothetical protein
VAATCCSQCGMIDQGMNTPDMKKSGKMVPMTTGSVDWTDPMNPLRANPMQQNAIEPMTTEAASDGGQPVVSMPRMPADPWSTAPRQ